MSELAGAEFDSEDPSGWKPVTLPALVGVVAVASVVAAIQRFSEGQWVPILDSANLALHEAGHPICGILSERLTVYGGTLFQLLFPAAAMFEFRRQRTAAGFAMALAWLGENLLNIGRYMADARAQELPLVGNGEHDWTEIFMRWGVLAGDVRIGGFTRFLGYVLIIGAAVWLYRRWRDSSGKEKSL